MFHAMRRPCFPFFRLAAGLWLMLAPMAWAAAEEIDAAIPPAVQALPAPTLRPLDHGLLLAISTSSEEAQSHVILGMTHLHGGWEFQSSRHFAAALRLDPDCLLATWGLVMTLLSPSPETAAARQAATELLIAQLEAGHGTDLERGYAYGLVKYLEEGPPGAANAFRKVAEKHPNDMQAALFSALFGRGGHDESGKPTPDQETSEKQLLALIEAHPASPIPLHALLSIRAEAGDLEPSLPLARKLVAMAPDYPPYLHLLGHYEWRCGNHERAVSALQRATTAYQAWMERNQVALADCPEWVKSESYRITALASQGLTPEALDAARKLAERPIDPERPAAPGSRALAWEGRTLAARLMLRGNTPKDAANALATLPPAAETRAMREHTLAHWWIDGLRLALETRRLLSSGKPDEARAALDALIRLGESMAPTQNEASARGERGHWNRAFRALEALSCQLRGELLATTTGATRATAETWLRSAADRHARASMAQPPTLPWPGALPLAIHQAALKQFPAAIASHQAALRVFPNDLPTLTSLLETAKAAGETKLAEETLLLLESLKPR
jgi:tetratricopeptide (TPR) repeat protein